MIKQLLFRIARSRAFGNVVSGLEKSYPSRPNLLRVLTYHRVEELDDHPMLYPSLISATPKIFEDQMSFLAKNYNVISMETLLNSLHNQSKLPERSILITFDDAYCSFADLAWPILKSLQLSVTLFVPTAYPGHPERMFWWDRLYQTIHSINANTVLSTPIGQLSLTSNERRSQAFVKLRNYIKKLPHQKAMTFVDQICSQTNSIKPVQTVLDWDALRRLAKEGVTIGAHSQYHPLMDQITTQEGVSEAIGSQQDVKREIGSAYPIFAYPSGAYTDEVAHALKQNGFTLAFTTMRGLNDMKTIDPLLLRRINVGKNTPFSLLRAQLLPWRNIFHPAPLNVRINVSNAK